MPALGDHTLVLPDGRRVGYSVYGDPDGRVVVSCHGGLVSGHDVGPAEADARALGVCILSPDRPGIGRTQRLPGYDTQAWVRGDLVALLDALGIGDLDVMGWSEGGQYALAAAHVLAPRVRRCAVIAGCLPLDDPVALRECNGLDRALLRLARRRPRVVRAYFATVRAASRHAPSLLERAAVRGLPAAEARAVRERHGWLPAILGEGATDPRGGVDEYLALGAPWGFLPEQVRTPVALFQGSADALVPASWAEQLAERLPAATLTRFPGEGHFIGLTRRRDVLEHLATT